MPITSLMIFEVLMGLFFFIYGLINIAQYLRENKKCYELVQGEVIKIKKTRPMFDSFTWFTPIIEYEYKGKIYHIESRQSDSSKGIIYRFAVNTDYKVGDIVSVRVFAGKRPKGVIDDKGNKKSPLVGGIISLILGTSVLVVTVLPIIFGT